MSAISLEAMVSSLEEGYGATCLSTRQAAMSTLVLAFLEPGDHLIATRTAEPSLAALTEPIRQRWGIETSEVDTSDLEVLEAVLRQNTRMILVESPSRSGLKVSDFAALSHLARRSHALLAVDSSLAGPHVQNPLSMGAHLILHPIGPLLGDPSTEGVVLVARQGSGHKKIRELSRLLGNRLDPDNIPATALGMATLPIRIERAQENARDLSEWLSGHPRVARVHQLGLETHPHHERARHQMRGPGPAIALEFVGGRKAALETQPRLPSFTPWLDRSGLLHLCVGFEDVQDLLKELDQALRRLAPGFPRLPETP